MEIRQQITDLIVKAMETGTLPWRKSWSSGSLHCNASSGAAYRGVNQLILAMAHPASGEVRWLTYKQAEYMGLQVRAGEKGTHIIKMVEVSRKQAAMEADAGSDVLAEDGSKALVMRTYTVFNASQIEGMAPMPTRECDITCADAVEQIVFGLQRTGLKINFGQGFQPAYYPRTDEVRIPPASEFHSLEDFHATLLHEAAGHATGHPKRLARLHMDARFGSPEYAREELRAELVSSMMQGVIGLPPGPTMIAQHSAYLVSWLQALKNDKNEIFRAAADAQKICDYVSKLALDAQPFVVRTMANHPKPSDLIVAAERSENSGMVHLGVPFRESNQALNRGPKAAF
jgi:antirestriction protein ArdC